MNRYIDNLMLIYSSATLLQVLLAVNFIVKRNTKSSIFLNKASVGHPIEYSFLDPIHYDNLWQNKDENVHRYAFRGEVSLPFEEREIHGMTHWFPLEKI